MELGQRFAEDDLNRNPLLFYACGHSYEMAYNNNWHMSESFVQCMGDWAEIWYASNIAFGYKNVYQ